MEGKRERSSIFNHATSLKSVAPDINTFRKLCIHSYYGVFLPFQWLLDQYSVCGWGYLVTKPYSYFNFLLLFTYSIYITVLAFILFIQAVVIATAF
jgi:hypothetical protein